MGEKDVIDISWKKALRKEFNQPYFKEIERFLMAKTVMDKITYPRQDLIFNAFNCTPFGELKAVILGQDPYHNPNQAMGLSFSVPRKMKIPPSLKNIYKELQQDIGLEVADHGDLSKWAEQGVLLLNSILTVEENKPGSHRKIGWQTFTDKVIEIISKEKSNVVFLLWGNYAKSKKDLIDSSKHLILEATHPSPLARGGFFGSKHFSETNTYLVSHGLKPIDWQL